MAGLSAFTIPYRTVARATEPSATTVAKVWRASPALLATALIGLLLLDQLLLWRFLGLVSTLTAAMVGIGGVALLGRFAFRLPASTSGPTAPTLRAAFAVALLVFVLGGEGRFFYATTDWQVRGAVLRDLTVYPWPYLYDVRATPDLLRAPIGIYLLPALVGKAIGPRGAELGLLIQNAAMLTILFGLGAALFETARARWRALAIFLLFSGMDAAGQMLAGQPLRMNAERWVMPVFSAHLSQAFWVPQHALAGWAAAILFLLWRERRLPLAAFLASAPLLTLWSPLAVMGAIPLAALAGWEALRRRELHWRTLAWPLAAAAIALPGLFYLAAGSAAVGGRPLGVPLNHYVLFELLEVGPYLLALAFAGWRGRFGGALLVTVAAILLVAPFIQVGQLGDFTMRASIPALAILALGVADLLGRPSAAPFWRRVALTALAIGAITPVFEIWRALTLPPAPRILCSYFGVVPGGYDTYVTPITRAPGIIAPPHPTLIKPRDPAVCWDGPWPGPMLFADQRKL